ncbi:aldehyde dehydrogenase family 3 member H1 isoform X1 [Gossypium arboreum]|uniref:aldehyde dehydrogenase family 3 member H1 isoform X1 n=1 Tax=Gossypium arboreum TaxID=29729 RepID=UPI000819541E|nr:aldehyde dehydrogenase family 3 member H1 isoform X1 [Gossypium arboreum]
MASEVEKKAVFDIDSAKEVVQELRASFVAGKTKDYEWRRTQLKAMLKMMDENEPQIVAALRDDLSKPELESSIYEIAMLKNSCKLALKKMKHWMMPEKAKTSLATFPSSAEIVSEPLGVVLVISAWNYPLLLSLDPVIGAIAAGNAIVLKPSEISPATASLLAKLVANYMDSSCIKVVEGAVPETTALLEQKWDKIMYTGNGRIGRIVMAAAAKHLTPVVLELGGKCPVIVDSGINLQVATRRIIAGKWGCNNGQACISPDYIITTKDYAVELVRLPVYVYICNLVLFNLSSQALFILQVDSFKCELERFYGKNPLESKDLSRVVNSNHFARLLKLLDEDKVSSKIVYGGERDKSNLKIAPTILLDVPQDSLIMNEEIFGPLLPIITIDKVEDSFDLINSGTKPLAAYMFTNNKKLKEKFVEKVSAGGLVINDTTVHLAEPTLPFGGVGDSGMGAYHGKFSFDTFSHKKAVLYRSFAGDAPLRYPPYTNGKLRLLKALLGGSILGIIRALMGWSKA